jgi:hypothetical protein
MGGTCGTWKHKYHKESTPVLSDANKEVGLRSKSKTTKNVIIPLGRIITQT